MATNVAVAAAPGLNVRAGIPFGQIISIMRQRRSQDTLLISQMIDIRDRYNNDVILPLPTLKDSPELTPPVPRLIAQAIDGTAMRAASPNPTISCPAMNPASDLSKRRAETRRRRLYASWKENQVRIKLYRSYRHLVGYGTCAWIVLPTDETKTAKIEIRDPLTAYPELRDPSDIRAPKNVGFVYGRSIDWISEHFPRAKEFFYNAAGKEWDTLWDVVEWVDETEIVIGILGPRMPAYTPQDSRPYEYNGFELARYPNKAGMVPVVVPRRITLDLVMGQMSAMVSTVDLHARLTGLQVVAAERHVFPDLVAISDQNAQAQVNNGNWRDGRTGEINVVTGARGVQYLTTQPNPAIVQTIGQLEEAIRESGGASGMFGGMNPGSLRTGRALDTMGSFAIDPRVEEVQRIEEQALRVLNEAVLCVEKGYYPSARQFCFTGLQGDDEMVEFTPGRDFETAENDVAYPIPGADVSQISVAIAQLVGAGLLSKHTGRVKHPFIDDAELEESKIAQEQIETGVLAAVTQQAASGQVPLPDAVRVLELLRGGALIENAVMTAQKEAQARQATQAPAPGPTQVTAPEAQPGLAAPGQGAEQPQGTQSPIPVPAASLSNFHALVRNLNSVPVTQPTGGPPGAP